MLSNKDKGTSVGFSSEKWNDNVKDIGEKLKTIDGNSYKVIADYPNSPYEIGDLVEISETGTSFHCTTTKEYDTFREEIVDVENYFSILKIDKYPHLFKKV